MQKKVMALCLRVQFFLASTVYEIAKVHKTNVPLRPVVSMVGTPEYKLAKYLDNLIKPQISDTYLLRSTENFIERLEECPCNNKTLWLVLTWFQYLLTYLY